MIDLNKNTDPLHRFIYSKEKEYGFKITLIKDEDAEFICNIRNNIKAKYLNKSSSEIKKQIEWIHDYKLREASQLEYYFIFWLDSQRIGTIRFIKVDNSTFESGSWLFVEGISFTFSVKAELFCKDFAFQYFNFSHCYFYINKENEQVIRYHKLFKPKLIKEDSKYLYFILDKDLYYQNRERILSFCR